jgi:hypothetical protein
MTFHTNIIFNIIAGSGHSKILTAEIQTLLAADANVCVNDPGIEPKFFIDLKRINRTVKKTRWIETLKARSRRIISGQVVLVQYNKRKGRSVSTFTVHIGTNHLADTTA